MAEQGKTKRTGAADAIAVRNRFFYVYYRKVSMLFIASLILCGVAGAMAVYFTSRSTPPIYLPVTTDGKLISTYPLDKPSREGEEAVMSATVKQWAFEVSKKLFTYDYLNYSEQISEAQSYFTVRGWNGYLATFEGSNNLNTVLDRRIIVQFIPVGAPVITDEGVDGTEKRYKWRVKFPAQIKYTAHAGNKTGFLQAGDLEMIFTRVSTVDSPKGIGLDQIIFRETKDAVKK